jgi:hypothetical protein
MRTQTSPPVFLVDILESAFVTQLEACQGMVMLGLDGENTITILGKHVHYSI